MSPAIFAAIVWPTFGDPQRLWWLLIVPALLLLYVGLLVWKARTPGSELVRIVDRAWVRHSAVGFALLSLVSLTLAWARPQGETLVPRERATVCIVMDVSLSMEAQDVPPTRLDAAKQSAKEFVLSLPPGFNVSVTEFAGSAATIVAPTTDRGMALAGIDRMKLRRATAAGEGIYAALDSLAMVPPDPRSPDGKVPAIIVLLSDGESQVGRSPFQAAKDAKARNIPVNTIAFGTKHGMITTGGQKTSVPVSTKQLREIAEAGGGQAYEAPTAEDLRKTYADIRRTAGLEKGYKEITEQFVAVGLILAALASVSMVSLGARWP